MRIPGRSQSEDPALEQVFQQQRQRWGAVLKPYEIYARRPSIFKSVVGMWRGLEASGCLEGPLTTLINRRVAALNGCVF